jgi:hypothetical protein
VIPEEVWRPLRRLAILGRLQPRATDLYHVDCDDRDCRALRFELLGALARHLGPLRLQVADPEGDAADLDRLGLAVDGAARLVTATTDLAALDDASLHQGGWLLYRSPHADLGALLGDRDPIRSLVLAELLHARELDAVVASFWNDREWVVGLRG